MIDPADVDRINRHFDQHIATIDTAAGVPEDAIAGHRRRYVRDVLANPEEMRQIWEGTWTHDAPCAYLAGPISDHPDNNRGAFTAAARWATTRGWQPVNPLNTTPEHPGPCPDGEPQHEAGHTHPYGCWIRANLAQLLTCDLVVMLPGWEASRGASHEHATALLCGLPIHYAPADS